MGNSVDLTRLNPSEVLESSSLKSYEDTLGLIWQQVCRLRSYLFILEKLLLFPSDPRYLFFGPDKQDFFELLNSAFTENSVLLITKLTTYRRDLLSMTRFKNWLRDQIRPEYKRDFDRLLKQGKFDKTIEKSRKSVQDIRNQRIAHFRVDENLHPKLERPKISFQKMSAIANELKRLFDLLCFGTECLTLPLQYEPKVQHPVGIDSRSDIEYFLDLLIQDTNLYKMPDESPYWGIKKQSLPPEIIGILNKYRRKFGKPEV
jgi:hypothetical protein